MHFLRPLLEVRCAAAIAISWAAICLFGIPVLGIPVLGNEQPPDFGRDVRPILAKHCFACHGPDAGTREAGLRLDQAAAATADLGGYAAIVPGSSAESELIARVTSTDPDQRMPPGDKSPPLNAQQVAVLTAWIDSGAEFTRHWAFVPPRRPAVPNVRADHWCGGAIDRFVMHKIEQAGLEPAPRASRVALIRRLYLDLTGTTPTPEEVDRWLADPSPIAYQKLVDRLLATPEYAERFARPWLDLARYADTNGYEKDRPRTIWPYRDWVIRAIAADMPLDQFTIEQVAGDMLPGATNDQRIATGFHRNTMLNEEGGIDPQEFRFYSIVDRVATTGTVWMGLTIGCAQCHTHKYDPITHDDYYALFALLNNADEPEIVVADPEVDAQRTAIAAQIDVAEQQLVDEYLPHRDDHLAGKIGENSIAVEWANWLDQQIDQTHRWQPLAMVAHESTMPKLTALSDRSILASGDVTKRDLFHLKFDLSTVAHPVSSLRLEALPHPSLPAGGPGMAFYEGRRGDFFLSELSVAIDGQPVELVGLSHSFGKISIGSGSAEAANVIDGNGSTGWSAAGNEGMASQLVANLASPATGKFLEVELLFERHFAAPLGRFRISVADDQRPAVASTLPEPLYDWHLDRLADINVADYQALQRHFLRSAPPFAELRKPIDALRRQLPEPVRTLGMRERSPEDLRESRRHHRGEYLQGKEIAVPQVPAVFEPLADSSPKDRLALARWLASDNNPLFERVIVNRAWREFFGTGIVDTAGDFGTQSDPPSHPRLLDWLATTLRQDGWSRQQLHRRIVLSATYQQAVGAAPPLDSRQRLLCGFPYRRLDAERVRDALLSASGLLSRRIGGPSVRPPQPASVTAMAWGSPGWTASSGGDRYRRSLYTFSKRTAPFAAYATFDGPTGETCVTRRGRSTTPLQALTLLNDQMYMEIAAGLAETAVRETGPDAKPATIARRIFRRLLVRDPDPQELQAILDFFDSQRGVSQPWTLVARALMNTDEAITVP